MVDPHANLAIRRSLGIKADIEAAETKCTEVVRELETRRHSERPLEVEVHRGVVPVNVVAKQVQTGAHVEAMARLRCKREARGREHVGRRGATRGGENGREGTEQNLLIMRSARVRNASLMGSGRSSRATPTR